MLSFSCCIKRPHLIIVCGTLVYMYQIVSFLQAPVNGLPAWTLMPIASKPPLSTFTLVWHRYPPIPSGMSSRIKPLKNYPRPSTHLSESRPIWGQPLPVAWSSCPLKKYHWAQSKYLITCQPAISKLEPRPVHHAVEIEFPSSQKKKKKARVDMKATKNPSRKGEVATKIKIIIITKCLMPFHPLDESIGKSA